MLENTFPGFDKHYEQVFSLHVMQVYVNLLK